MKRSKTADKTSQNSRRKGFTVDDYKRMIALYESGQSSKEVAEEFGCSFGRVLQVLHEHGVKVRSERSAGKFSDDDRKQMAVLYDSGKTCQEIADSFGCSSTAVMNILHKLGVKMRPSTCRKSGWNPDRQITQKPSRIEDIPAGVRTRIVEMYKAGNDQKTIESVVGLTKKEVRQILNSAGVVRRTSSHFQPRYTAEDHKRMVEMYDRGLSIRAIADEFSCVRSALTRILLKLGVELRPAPPRRTFTNAERDKMVEMSEDGYRNAEIALEFECPQDTVRGILRKHRQPPRIAVANDYSDADKQRMLELYRNGFATQAIAEEFACGKKLIREILSANGVKKRPNSVPDKVGAKNRRRILAMCKEGISGLEIAEKFGYDLAIVSLILKKLDTPPASHAQSSSPIITPIKQIEASSIPPVRHSLDAFIRNFWATQNRAVDMMLMASDVREKIVAQVNDALKYAYEKLGPK